MGRTSISAGRSRAHLGSGEPLPTSGTVFLSIRDDDKRSITFMAKNYRTGGMDWWRRAAPRGSCAATACACARCSKARRPVPTSWIHGERRGAARDQHAAGPPDRVMTRRPSASARWPRHPGHHHGGGRDRGCLPGMEAAPRGARRDGVAGGALKRSCLAAVLLFARWRSRRSRRRAYYNIAFFLARGGTTSRPRAARRTSWNARAAAPPQQYARSIDY